jgi:hypothetical protein
MPDLESARAIYRELAAGKSAIARAARRLADQDTLGLVLPVTPMEPDPRAVE